MSAYEMTDLIERGMAPVARLLITRAGRFSTATYGEARRMLEMELGIDRIFSTHPGGVVGTMMNRLWSHDPSLPPLNVLMVNRGGIPGKGADSFIAEWSGRRYSSMTAEKRALILAEASRAVWAFRDWAKIYEEVFGAAYTATWDDQPIITPGEYGGPAESDEHRRLKEAIAADPRLAVPVSAMAVATPESKIRSGDEVDIHVVDLDREYAIEVKSFKSHSGDLERGIYQVVKYRAVIEAQYRALGAEGIVIGVLVTEKQLPTSLKNTARKLNVRTKIVSVNV